jgi:broad specificity phosphatase PhoE
MVFAKLKRMGDFYNPRLRHQDEPISQQGQPETRKLWSYLCDKEISAISDSDYGRAGETIQYVAEQSGITSARLPQPEIDMIQSYTVGHASSVTMPDIVTLEA